MRKSYILSLLSLAACGTEGAQPIPNGTYDVTWKLTADSCQSAGGCSALNPAIHTYYDSHVLIGKTTYALVPDQGGWVWGALEMTTINNCPFVMTAFWSVAGESELELTFSTENTYPACGNLPAYACTCNYTGSGVKQKQ